MPPYQTWERKSIPILKTCRMKPAKSWMIRNRDISPFPTHIYQKLLEGGIAKRNVLPPKNSGGGSVCVGEIPMRESLSLYTGGLDDCARWGRDNKETLDRESRKLQAGASVLRLTPNPGL